VVGREGKGKSGTALAIAEMVDPNMNLKQVMFDPGQMLKRVHQWKQSQDTQGRMIVADEAGVGLGNRTWHDEDQIRFAKVLQLIRSENMGILFTVPRGKEMDSQIRGGRLHGQIIIDQKADGDYTTAQYERVNVGRRIDADWLITPKPDMNIEDVDRPIKQIRIGPPSDSLWEDYSGKKDKFQQEEYKDAAGQMGADIDDEDEVDEIKQVVNDILDDNVEVVVSEHGQNGRAYVNKDLVYAHYEELSRADANAAKSMVEKELSQEELNEFI